MPIILENSNNWESALLAMYVHTYKELDPS